MAQLSCVSDTEALVQSMLQRLRLQEQRSEQASTTSEDLTQTIQEVVENGHNTDEQVSFKVSSEVKEHVVLPPPIREAERESTRCSQGYDSISLSAFDLGFSTGSLMEEMFTGTKWSTFLASSDQEVPENTNDNSTYLAAAKQCENILSQDASSPPEKKLNSDTETMLVDTSDAAPIVDQPLYSESSEHSFNQLASSGPVSHNQSLTSLGLVSHNQSWTVKVNSDQPSPTELNSNESQTTTDNTDQSNIGDQPDQSNIGDQPDQCFRTGSESITCDINDRETHMDDVNLDQSEFGSQSNAGDIKDQQIHMTEPDLNQTGTSDMNPYQTEITTPDLNQTSASDTNPYQTEITAPHLNQTSTSDMNPYQIEITAPHLNQTSTSDMNPYQTRDQSETEDITSCQSTTPTINSSLGRQGDAPSIHSSLGRQGDAPQFIPLLDFSFLKTGDDVDSSAHKRNRRTRHSEERETFIDEDDDDDVPSKPVSHQEVKPSPPPFPPPPPPPSQFSTQRSISSDSSASVEIVPKKVRVKSSQVAMCSIVFYILNR
ncbi:ras guanine nucleotide exchange factor N-like [Clupea harengus]|uniref:Ras guanine nucleotide exchange factor N-like n=1 Tax=Clupea harengus TaxID=7950 RepID=A0A6P8EDB2_CLUHA|nr:ras guanine nucleotide exchange factor N-like [Clupea harengus]